MMLSSLSRPHRAAVEIGILAFLYAVYEVVRGAGDTSLSVARDHTADIVSLERTLNVFNERAVQEWSRGVPFLPMLLGIAYMVLHFGATGFAVRWVYRERREAFPLVRTTLIVSTAIALAGYVLYPAAPPRLSGLGFSDTVTTHTGLNLSSDLLGSFYNPVAAVRRCTSATRSSSASSWRARAAPVGARARRALSRVHALRHRRHREPLLVRRDGRRRGRRRRLVDGPRTRQRIKGAGAVAAEACPERTCPGDCPWASR